MASLFWVGGSTAYDGVTARLATTTGGSATVAAITSADTVTFDGSSPAGAVVTTSAAISCANLTLASGFTGSLTMSNTLTVATTFTHSQGTLNTNGQTCSWGQYTTSGVATRALTLGASQVTTTSGGLTQWSVASNSGLTFTAGTSTIICNGSGGGANSFIGAGLTYNNLTITWAGTFTITGTNTFNNLTYTGSALKTNILQFGANQTISGTLNITGNSTINRVSATADVIGTTRTITAAAISFANVDFMDITGAGLAANAAWTGTSMGDGLGNSNITFDAPVTRFAVVAGNWSSTATWSTSSGGAGGASVPLPQDTVNFNASSAAGTYVMDMPRACADLNCTGFTRTLQTGTTVVYGNLTLGSAMTYTNNARVNLNGRGAQTITSSGITHPGPISIQSPGGSYTLQDNLISISASSFAVNVGTFATNNFAMSMVGFALNNTNSTRTLAFGTSQITLTGTGTVWGGNVTGVTITGNYTIILSDTSSTLKTFSGAGAAFNNLIIYSPVDSARVTITGANTYNWLEYRDPRLSNNNFAAVKAGDGMSVGEKIR